MSVINIAFIITSVINTISTDLTYGTRSFYSMKERFEQTLQTIHSIKKYVPTAHIYLIEGSDITYDMEFVLESLVYKYINVFSDKYIRKSVESKLKGYGEATQLYYIFSNYRMDHYDAIFKISGRYYLNSDFNLQDLIQNNKVIFCNGKKRKQEIVSTVLYFIPNNYLKDIYNTYKLVIKIYDEYESRLLRGDMESLHYERIVPKILKEYSIHEKIGVEGLVSSYKALYKC
jgi:hypothetical protein